MAGQSLSNTLARKPATASLGNSNNSGGSSSNNSSGSSSSSSSSSSSRVQGPRSALSSFLEESKIVAPLSRRARAADPPLSQTDHAADDEPDNDSAAATAARQQARIAAVQQALADVGDATGQLPRRRGLPQAFTFECSISLLILLLFCRRWRFSQIFLAQAQKQ
jgi:hypothetical protein